MGLSFGLSHGPLIWGKSWVHVLYVIGGDRGVVWGRGWGRVWGGSARTSVHGVVWFQIVAMLHGLHREVFEAGGGSGVPLHWCLHLCKGDDGTSILHPGYQQGRSR